MFIHCEVYYSGRDFGFDKERESEREIRVDGGEEVAVVKR